jgi:Carboxypeptidase regulatory-like domain
VGKVKYTFRAVSLRLALAALFVVYSIPAIGQVDQGTVTGVVQDAQHAVVPNAEVTLTNTDTKFQLRAKTDGSGVYTFPPVKAGQYSIQVTAPGFETYVENDLNVEIAQRLGVNVTLKLGAVSQKVEVSATTRPLLQTQDASTGQEIGSQVINDTPLNGRNYVFITQLTAGVLPANGNARGAATGDFSANGQRAEENNFILDGVDNNVNLLDFLNGASFVIKPPPDALQEFRVQTSGYSAELGRASGAVLNVSVKSGTNNLHGDVWEYFRNTNLNAKNYFNSSVPPYHQNQFGATLGGPFIKNKLFFFGDAEGNRITAGQNATYTVPTPQMITGDFSQLLSPALTGGQPRTLYLPGGPTRDSSGTITNNNYLTCNGRQNVICNPDPVAQGLLKEFPAPNLGVPGQTYNNYLSEPKTLDNTTQYDARVDWNATAKDQAFARYSYSNDPKFTAPPFGILDGGSFFGAGGETIAHVTDEGRNFTASETHVFNPKLVNEFRFGYNWIRAEFLQQNSGTAISPSFSIGGIPFGPENGGLPAIFASGISPFGSPQFMPSDERMNTIQALDNLTKIMGNHTLKGGVNFQYIRYDILQPQDSRGTLNYTGQFSEDPQNAGVTGFGLADMELNDMNSSTLATEFTAYNRRIYYSAYIQDDWRVSPRLTLNLGLRWEYVTPIEEANGDQANLIPDFANDTGVYLLPDKMKGVALPPSFLQILSASNIQVQYSSNKYLVNPTRVNVLPRLGMAYSITNKLVARAGFGLFYNDLEQLGQILSIGNVPFQFDNTYYSGATLTGCAPGNCATNGQTLETTFANAPISIVGPTTVGADVHDPSVRTVSYNLTTEYALNESTSAQIGYVGSVTSNLFASYVNNQSPAGVVGPGTAIPYPFPLLGGGVQISPIGISNYNALQAKLERRYVNGLQFLAAYTYSHTLEDTEEPFGALGAGGSRNIPLLGAKYDYGEMAGTDVRHRFVINGTYQLPIGSGNKFLNKGGIINQVAGGWMLALTFRVQSGEPEDIFANNNPTNVGGTADAYRVANPYKPGGTPPPNQPGVTCATKTRTIQNWWNPCAFDNPTPAQFASKTQLSSYGPSGRTDVAGPGYNRVDMSVFKSFPTYRGQSLQFRADFFNLFNHPAIGQPGNMLGSGFGQITTERFGGDQQDARTIQLALKYFF